MSHSHRDENQLTDVEPVEVEPVVVPPPQPAVANSEAERKAQEKRKLEGVGEQMMQHQFTGDLPEPDRGGTDTETRLVFGDGGADDDDATASKAAAARRGPPAPRFEQVEGEVSWAAPPAAYGAMLPAAHTAWTHVAGIGEAAMPRGGPSWGR